MRRQTPLKLTPGWLLTLTLVLLAVLDCGQGEVPYRIGDELRAEPS